VPAEQVDSADVPLIDWGCLAWRGAHRLLLGARGRGWALLAASEGADVVTNTEGRHLRIDSVVRTLGAVAMAAGVIASIVTSHEGRGTGPSRLTGATLAASASGSAGRHRVHAGGRGTFLPSSQATLPPASTTSTSAPSSSTTTSTASSIPQSPGGATPPPGGGGRSGQSPSELVRQAAAATAALPSAELAISFSASGSFGGQQGTVTGSIAGAYDFVHQDGTFRLSVQGIPAIQQLLGAGPVTMGLSQGTACLALANGQQVKLQIGPLFSEFLPSAGPLASTMASNPVDALVLFSTPVLQASPVGATSLYGAPVEAYQATVDVAAAASAGGPAAPIYQQIEQASPTTQSIGAELWVDGQGHVRQIGLSGEVPGSNGGAPTTFSVLLGFSNFGVSVTPPQGC
jgi:hypothetical protein